MLRLIVSTPADQPGERQMRTFDANAPELEEWLAKITEPLGKLCARVESLEVVQGRARKARKTEAAKPAPIPCPYEAFLKVYHEELVRWIPPAGSTEQAVDLAPVPNRYGQVWVKRKKLMDAMWLFILTSRRSDGSPRATNEEQALAWLRAYFRRARRDDWMMGRRDPNAWRADFDYLVAERAWDKVINNPRTA